MDIYIASAQAIIKAQEKVIGPIAFEQAMKVSGLSVKGNTDIKITGDAKLVLADLVKQYERLFGKASVEVCRDAVKEIKPPVPSEQLPDVLQ